MSISQTIKSDTRQATSSPGAQFWFSRLGSFLSIAPLGVWTINHIWDNLAAFAGAKEWERSVTGHRDPIAFAVTVFLVWAPLLIHAAWGVRRLFSFRSNNLAYNYFGNFKYLVQRITGAGLLFWIGAHTWLAFLQPRLVKGHPEPFSDIAREMRFHMMTPIVYLIGTTAVAYHLANGFWSFMMSWGIVTTERSLTRMNAAAIVLFVILTAMSWGAIFALYQAGEALGPVAATP